MKIAYIIFDGITWLDLIGIYDPICRLKAYKYLPDLEWDFCSMEKSAKDSYGTEILASNIKPDLSSYDMIIIPGGFGTRELRYDEDFISWIKSAEQVPYKVSICTGSLILGAAGFLREKQVTTHFNEYEALKGSAKKVHPHRIVRDGNILTAGAVASSLDMGLYICQMLAGESAKERIRQAMDYHPADIEILEVNP
ncbi:MAG: DJ-1/PfpI family protein [Bacteroidota bacterium]